MSTVEYTLIRLFINSEWVGLPLMKYKSEQVYMYRMRDK